MNEVALITGANKGIGFAIARQLGKHGMMIIVAARNPQRGEHTSRASRTKALTRVPSYWT